jgi:hypothetical protein
MICYYNSHEVSLCADCIYSLYVEAAVVLARYILSFDHLQDKGGLS